MQSSLAIPTDAEPGPHAMNAIDRETIDDLLSAREPSDADIVHAARLVMRYCNFSKASIQMPLLERVVRQWHLSFEELFSMARAIWQSGRGPQALADGQQVGSGSDVEA